MPICLRRHRKRPFFVSLHFSTSFVPVPCNGKEATSKQARITAFGVQLLYWPLPFTMSLLFTTVRLMTSEWRTATLSLNLLTLTSAFCPNFNFCVCALHNFLALRACFVNSHDRRRNFWHVLSTNATMSSVDLPSLLPQGPATTQATSRACATAPTMSKLMA